MHGEIMEDNNKLKKPGPFWIWLVAAVILSQVVKRGIIGWPMPKEFNFGSRFIENLVSNVLYGLPVIALYIILLVIMNLKKDEKA